MRSLVGSRQRRTTRISPTFGCISRRKTVGLRKFHDFTLGECSLSTIPPKTLSLLPRQTYIRQLSVSDRTSSGSWRNVQEFLIILLAEKARLLDQEQQQLQLSL